MKIRIQSHFGFFPLVAAGLLCWVPMIAHAEVKDACTVLDSADAQAVLGDPVSTGKGSGSDCRFVSTVGKGFSAKSLFITIRYSTTDLTGYEGQIADTQKQAGYKNVHPVAGVGHAAIWGEMAMMGRPQGELTVIKNKSVMVIILISGLADQAAALDRAKTLAAKILPKT